MFLASVTPVDLGGWRSFNFKLCMAKIFRYKETMCLPPSLKNVAFYKNQQTRQPSCNYIIILEHSGRGIHVLLTKVYLSQLYDAQCTRPASILKKAHGTERLLEAALMSQSS